MDCCICREEFDNPVTTPCGHSFCAECWRAYRRSKRSSLTLKCPSGCGFEIPVSLQLRPSVSLKSVLDKEHTPFRPSTPITNTQVAQRQAPIRQQLRRNLLPNLQMQIQWFQFRLSNVRFGSFYVGTKYVMGMLLRHVATLFTGVFFSLLWEPLLPTVVAKMIPFGDAAYLVTKHNLFTMMQYSLIEWKFAESLHSGSWIFTLLMLIDHIIVTAIMYASENNAAALVMLHIITYSTLLPLVLTRYLSYDITIGY